MANAGHREVLSLIRENSGKGTAHTFQDTYLGTTHPRYEISAPTLRLIAKEWTKEHRDYSPEEIVATLSSLMEGKSMTEKVIGGMILDYLTAAQRNFHPKVFDKWADELEGWAEVDAVFTGKFTTHHLPEFWPAWKPLLLKFRKSRNIHKRRASLVVFCLPVRYCPDRDMIKTAFEIIDELKNEKHILITKAISWVLRSMIKLHRADVVDYLDENRHTLPAIAVRETEKVLLTGKKTN